MGLSWPIGPSKAIWDHCGNNGIIMHRCKQQNGRCHKNHKTNAVLTTLPQKVIVESRVDGAESFGCDVCRLSPGEAARWQSVPFINCRRGQFVHGIPEFLCLFMS